MLDKFIVFTLLTSSVFGCLITNCPRGGKRNAGLSPFNNSIRECPSCGLDKQGQCFGPHICCGPTMGCFIGTPEAHRCRKESLFSRPCTAGFAMCRGNTGRCAANDICCTQESCFVDTNCRIGDETNGNDQSLSSKLNTLLLEGTF